MGIVSGLQGGKNWSVQSWMDIGQQQYAGSGITISNLPPVLYGADWIKTGFDSSGDPGQFTVSDNAWVFVAMDIAPDQRPAWLSGYEVTGLKIENDDNGGRALQVYRKKFNKGETVSLGPNKGTLMYTVAVLPVTTLAPATDLRKNHHLQSR